MAVNDYKVGDRVRLIRKKPMTLEDMHVLAPERYSEGTYGTLVPYRGEGYYIAWTDKLDKILNQPGEIVENRHGLVMLVKFDSGIKHYVHHEWLVPDEKVECICDINTLIDHGCVCGAFKKEVAKR